jgi:flagellar basal body-associated protein FliL
MIPQGYQLTTEREVKKLNKTYIAITLVLVAVVLSASAYGAYTVYFINTPSPSPTSAPTANPYSSTNFCTYHKPNRHIHSQPNDYLNPDSYVTTNGKPNSRTYQRYSD